MASLRWGSSSPSSPAAFSPIVRSLSTVRSFAPGTYSRWPMRVPIRRSCAVSAAPPRTAACTSAALKPMPAASASASATAWIPRPTITWLTTFIAWPAPGPPTRTTLPPRMSNSGRARSKSASSAPTMIASVPCSVPSGLPDTGASAQPTPRSARRSARPRESSGSELPMSITSEPGRRCGSSCSSTTPVAAESDSMAITTSAAAASAMFSTSVTPAAAHPPVSSDSRPTPRPRDPRGVPPAAGPSGRAPPRRRSRPSLP